MDRQEEIRAPTQEDFSGRNIEKYVFLQAAKHPVTWGPLGIAGLASLAAVSGGGLEALAGAVLLGVIGLGHGIYKWLIKGEDTARRRVEELRAQLEKSKQVQLRGLLMEFTQADFREGVELVNRLVSIHRQIVSYLQSKVTRDQNTSAARFLALANNTYEQGLRVARQAFAIHAALAKMDPRKLNKDLKTAQQQLTALEKEGSGEQNGSTYQSLSRKVKSCQGRLDRYGEYEDRLLKMIEQGDRMAEALENAYVDVGTMIEKTELEFSESDSARTLERAIEAARKVDAAIFGSENGENEEDEIYREVGSRNRNQEPTTKQSQARERE